MEYAQQVNGEPFEQICDYNFMRYVGYEQDNECILKYFSQETVDIISHKVSQLLEGVDPEGKTLIIPDSTICSVMSSVQNSYKPAVGCIYSRYIVPSETVDEYQSMIDQVVEIITSQVRNSIEMDECNSKLTIWTTILGNFNEHGLRSHSQIKVRDKKPPSALFNMNY